MHVLASPSPQYVSEAVAAVAEAPPARAGDAAAAVEVASALHQTYAEFGQALGPALAKAFGSKLAGGAGFCWANQGAHSSLGPSFAGSSPLAMTCWQSGLKV